MNGNWNGISSRYSNEPTHHKLLNSYQEGAEPSMDVINTIIASYAASTCDDHDSRHVLNQSGLENYGDRSKPTIAQIEPRGRDIPRDDNGNRFRFNEGCIAELKTSTPVKSRFDQTETPSPTQFVHPFALKVQKQEEDAESNAATDQSGNRSETEESYRETAGEIGHSISVVTKKLHWATQQLEEISSIDGSINAVRLVSECAQTIAHLKKAKLSK